MIEYARSRIDSVSAFTSGRATCPAFGITTFEKSGASPGRTAGSGMWSFSGAYSAGSLWSPIGYTSLECLPLAGPARREVRATQQRSSDTVVSGALLPGEFRHGNWAAPADRRARYKIAAWKFRPAAGQRTRAR